MNKSVYVSKEALKKYGKKYFKRYNRAYLEQLGGGCINQTEEGLFAMVDDLGSIYITTDTTEAKFLQIMEL